MKRFAIFSLIFILGFFVSSRSIKNSKHNLSSSSAGNIKASSDNQICIFCHTSHTKGKNFPFCLDRKFYVIDKEDNQYVVNILSIVRKTEKNAQ